VIGERPFVILNVAMTVDGKIDTAARRGAAISSPRDRERVDRLRSESDAVMVGGRTLLGDDPKLTVKSPALRDGRRARGLDENPIKVGVLSDAARLRSDCQFLTAGPARVFLYTTQQTGAVQLARLRESGVSVFVVGERHVDLPAMMRSLRTHGVARLLVEGGSTLNAALLYQRLVDEITIYVAPLIFGGADAPTLAGGPGFPREEAVRLQELDVEQLEDGGVVIHYRVL
jgi:2,5-diamino-6-(ribosylamino)-4(3H)-pyrimidinone 5'-phosphate reductase